MTHVHDPSCAPWREDLVDLIYDELPGPRRQALERHLRGCAACSAELAELQATRSAFAALPELEPRPQVTYDILRAARLAVAQDEPAQDRAAGWLPRWVLTPALGTAFAVLLVAGVMVALRSGTPSEPVELAPSSASLPSDAATERAASGPGLLAPEAVARLAAAPAAEPAKAEAENGDKARGADGELAGGDLANAPAASPAPPAPKPARPSAQEQVEDTGLLAALAGDGAPSRPSLAEDQRSQGNLGSTANGPVRRLREQPPATSAKEDGLSPRSGGGGGAFSSLAGKASEPAPQEAPLVSRRRSKEAIEPSSRAWRGTGRRAAAPAAPVARRGEEEDSAAVDALLGGAGGNVLGPNLEAAAPAESRRAEQEREPRGGRTDAPTTGDAAALALSDGLRGDEAQAKLPEKGAKRAESSALVAQQRLAREADEEVMEQQLSSATSTGGGGLWGRIFGTRDAPQGRSSSGSATLVQQDRQESLPDRRQAAAPARVPATAKKTVLAAEGEGEKTPALDDLMGSAGQVATLAPAPAAAPAPPVAPAAAAAPAPEPTPLASSEATRHDVDDTADADDVAGAPAPLAAIETPAAAPVAAARPAAPRPTAAKRKAIAKGGSFAPLATPPPPERLQAEAQEAFARGDYAAALLRYQALRTRGASGSADLGAARSLVALGRAREAIPLLERYTATGPADSTLRSALAELATLYERQGATEAARRTWSRYSERWPSDERALGALQRLAARERKARARAVELELDAAEAAPADEGGGRPAEAAPAAAPAAVDALEAPAVGY